jgi:nicotinamide mononucleotide transporter
MRAFEKVWLVSFALIILATTVVFSISGTDWANIKSVLLNWGVSPIAALSGVFCVVLVARGHIANYSFGIVNALAYGLIAWVSGYYGDWILNWFFFFPTQIFILTSWRKNLRSRETRIVRMKKLTPLQILYVSLLGIAFLVGFALALHYVDFWFVNVMKRSASMYTTIETAFGIPLLGPLFDSSTEVFQVIAQILLIKRYAEQWPLWIATNVITIIMWVAIIVADPTSVPWAVPTLVMWIAFLINSVYGCYRWYKECER